ncbi:MAG: FKBP-type peptidyl-prolyl cis-trans isomerase [Deltaproteobacteria bacterium]|nr:FKBP-type peptidyl-prolyl cis-trans isomerase [Deltaproteobacteria bacterium]
MKSPSKTPRQATAKARAPQTYRGRTGLESDVLKAGTGAGAKGRDILTVHYTARLPTGEQVDSSRERGTPLTFKLGTGAVIDGWDEALKGAQVGEVRKITVPPALAYGKKGTKKVPPNATIIFEVELLKIEAP